MWYLTIRDWGRIFFKCLSEPKKQALIGSYAECKIVNILLAEANLETSLYNIAHSNETTKSFAEKHYNQSNVYQFAKSELRWLQNHEHSKSLPTDDFQSVLCTLESLLIMVVSCTTSQNVNICATLPTWSKYKVSKQPALWMQSGRRFMFRSFSYHLMKQLWSCQSNERLQR